MFYVHTHGLFGHPGAANLCGLTAVTPYLKRKQLLLLVFAGQCRKNQVNEPDDGMSTSQHEIIINPTLLQYWPLSTTMAKHQNNIGPPCRVYIEQTDRNRPMIYKQLNTRRWPDVVLKWAASVVKVGLQHQNNIGPASRVCVVLILTRLITTKVVLNLFLMSPYFIVIGI